MTTVFMEKFLWNTLLINMGFFLFWVIAMTIIPNFIYKIQQNFFSMDKKDWYRVNYMLMGFYKILLILFVLAPYVALKML